MRNNKILPNKLDLKNKKEINELEMLGLTNAYIYIYKMKVDSQITNKLMKRLHEITFGELYGWAGEYRTVNLSKDNFKFSNWKLIPENMEKFEENFLKKYTPFKKKNLYRIARILAEIQSEFLLIHPFREGNGRIGRLVCDIIALQAQLPVLDYGIYKDEKMKELYIRAVQKSFLTDYELLENFIIEAIEKSKRKGKI